MAEESDAIYVNGQRARRLRACEERTVESDFQQGLNVCCASLKLRHIQRLACGFSREWLWPSVVHGQHNHTMACQSFSQRE